MAGHLEKFFEPRSVAIIGASSTPHKPGNDVVRNILANEYSGKLYLVNPERSAFNKHQDGELCRWWCHSDCQRPRSGRRC